MADGLAHAFDMPDVDGPAETEVGVILLGLDAERLVAGLGLAALTDDAATVALAVDHVRHGVGIRWTTDTLVAAGCARWAEVSAELADVPSITATTPRQGWAHASAAVEAVVRESAGPAGRTYLIACWMRRSEIDRWVENRP